MNHNLIKDIQILNLSGDTTGTAAATTEAPGCVDMQGFDGVLFIALSATTGFEAATDMFVKEAATTAATFLTCEAGGGVVACAAAASTSKQALVLDVYRPKDRYVMAGFTSGTIGDVREVIAIQYGGSKPPVAPSTADPVYYPVIPAAITCVATPSTA